MSRLAAVGLAAFALAVFGGIARAEKPDDAPIPATEIKNQSTQPIDVGSPDEVKSRAKIAKALDEQTKFEFNETPLHEVVEDLKMRHHVEIQLDAKVLEEASIGVDTPVTRYLQGITLRSALRLMLGAMDLTYIIKDEVLLITTRDKSSNELVIKIYPVGDLTAPRSAASGGENFRPLVEAIRATIAPTTWDEVGGPGSIVPLAQARSLIVSQTDEVHEQIFELLSGLRQARDAQPPAPKLTGLGTLVDAMAELKARWHTGHVRGKGESASGMF